MQTNASLINSIFNNMLAVQAYRQLLFQNLALHAPMINS